MKSSFHKYGYDKIFAAEICSKLAPSMFPKVERLGDNLPIDAVIHVCNEHPGTVYYSIQNVSSPNNTNEATIIL